MTIVSVKHVWEIEPIMSGHLVRTVWAMVDAIDSADRNTVTTRKWSALTAAVKMTDLDLDSLYLRSPVMQTLVVTEKKAFLDL